MSAYSSLVVADGATSYWRLNEGGLILMETGDSLLLEDGSRLLQDFATAVDSVNARNGSLPDGAVSTAGTIFGDTDTAYSLGGNPTFQFVQVADNNAFSIDTTNALTIEAWWNVNAGSGNNFGLVVKGDYIGLTQCEYLLTIGRTGLGVANAQWEATTAAGTTDIFYIQSAFIYPVGTWHHVAAVSDKTAGTALLYVNGVLVVSGTWNGNTYTNGTHTLDIGLGSQYFEGSIDEVAIYPTALTGQQVLNHYELGSNNYYRPRELGLIPQLIAQ